jgi:hypothetical protein
MNFARGIDREPVPLGEVIENRDGVSGIEELLDANAADVSGAAGDEKVHEEVESAG